MGQRLQWLIDGAALAVAN